MAIEDTKRLKSTNSESEANIAISHGWTLLQLQPMSEGTDSWIRYHLGWQKAGEPAPEFGTAPLSLGAHAVQP